MIQTPWYSTIIVLIKTFQKQLKVLKRTSKTIFFYFFLNPCLVKWEKTRHVKLHGKTRLQYPKFWLRGGQRLKLRHDLDGCSLHSWPSERREIRSTLHVHDANKQTHTKKTLQSLSLILSKDHKWSIFAFFCYEASERACSRCGHRFN